MSTLVIALKCCFLTRQLLIRNMSLPFPEVACKLSLYSYPDPAKGNHGRHKVNVEALIDEEG